MLRFLRNKLLLLTVLAAVIIGAAWYLLQNEDFLKSQLSAYAVKKTGRELTVDGPLQLNLGRETRIDARGIRFQNASWSDSPEMVSVGHLRVAIDVLSLFGDTPVIPSLLLEDCRIELVRNEMGAANWDVLPDAGAKPAPKRTSGLPVLLLDAHVRNCQLSHDAPNRKQPLKIAINELALQLIEGNRWQGSGTGRVNDEALSFTGKLAPAGAFLHGEPLQYEVELGMGQNSLRSSGSIEDPRTGQGANLTFNLKGPDMAAVLDRFQAPPVSSGAFDFRLTLDTKGQMTELSVEGDLGSLDLNASGQLDRLVRPQSGAITAMLTGPDLEALGATLDVQGLVREPFSLQAEVSIDDGIARARTLVLNTSQDRLEVTGALGRAPTYADSELTVHAASDEIGRWRTRTHLPSATTGAADLAGVLKSDGNGLFSTVAKLNYADSTLDIQGKLGSVGSTFEPAVEVAIESPDAALLAAKAGFQDVPAAPLNASGHVALAGSMVQMTGVQVTLGGHHIRVDGQLNPVKPFVDSLIEAQLISPSIADLGRMFGRDGLPEAPLTAQGRISRPDQRLRFEGVNLDMAGHRATIDGYLNPDQHLSGSQLQVQLDSPDVATLARLFGQEGLPHEAMNLAATLESEGKGLRFQTSQGSMGDIRLATSGQVPNLQEPLRLDADFDIQFPSLTLLKFLAPNTTLPDLPFTALGRLRNHPGRTQLENVRLTLGEFTADITGDVFADERFALAIDAGGPDASQLKQWLGWQLVPEPISLKTRVAGEPGAFDVSDIDAQLGKSQAGGNLQIGLGTRKTISGQLTSPYLDLSQLATGAEEEPPAIAPPSSAFVFDDTEVMWINDFGVDVDVDLNVSELNLGNTRLRDVVLGVLLEPNRLKLAPFSLTGDRSGTLSGRAVLDDSGAKPVLDVELAGEGLRLGLAAAPDQEIASYPETDIELVLHGTGVTRREMASNLNGRMRVYSGSGQIASAGVDLLFSDFLTELFNLLNPFAESSEYTQLECSVAAANISDGQVDVRPVVFNTEGITIFSSGSIDLRTEKINLSFNTKPRKGLGITAGTVINTLIKVGGTLKKPSIDLDPAGAIVGGTAAVATAGLSIVAKSFADRFLSSKDPCGDARKEIEKQEP